MILDAAPDPAAVRRHWPACRLCRSSTVTDFAVAHGRRYGTCQTCGLIQLAAEQHPDPAAARAHYLTHHNDPTDAGYRSFLHRLAGPLVAHLPTGAQGLDYGSGPGPTLSAMLEEQGFRVRLFDPIFAPDASALQETYDFITCTETMEHFLHPAGEFERLDRMLRPGGWLAIMTEVYREQTPFTQWRYARDPTHVCFCQSETMTWLAERFGYRMLEPHETVRLFQKPSVFPPEGTDE